MLFSFIFKAISKPAVRVTGYSASLNLYVVSICFVVLLSNQIRIHETERYNTIKSVTPNGRYKTSFCDIVNYPFVI